MVAAATTDDDFIRSIESIGVAATAKAFGVDRRNVIKRRNNLERKYCRQITPPDPQTPRQNIQHQERIHFDIENGVAICGGDGHYWPGAASTAHRAFVKFCRDLSPKLIVNIGDSFDGASISRHPPIGWEKQPTVVAELEACRERLSEIEDAAPPKANLAWVLGNHDGRYETRLAQQAPEYAKVNGFHLKDHFGPRWRPAWAVWINDQVVCKHRLSGGVHAAHNNALKAGKTTVTGHTHSAKVSPWTDYNGTRWGVECGCLAYPWGPQFEYAENNPRNWIEGFAVLTFHSGKLLPPELVTVWDENTVVFRGNLIKV